MKFKKNVSAEKRELLREQLKHYKKEMTMSVEELALLEEWVAKGNSPYENGDYVYTDYGYPMDFVSALRFIDDQNEWFASLPEEEQDRLRNEMSGNYDTLNDEAILTCPEAMSESYYKDNELPFS